MYVCMYKFFYHYVSWNSLTVFITYIDLFVYLYIWVMSLHMDVTYFDCNIIQCLYVLINICSMCITLSYVYMWFVVGSGQCV